MIDTRLLIGSALDRTERCIASDTPMRRLHRSTMEWIYTIAVQVGTGIAMIKRHYSHLPPRLRKEMLTGRQYYTSEEECDEFTETL